MSGGIGESKSAEKLRNDLAEAEWSTMLLTGGVLIFGFGLGAAYLGLIALGMLPPGDESFAPVEAHTRTTVLASCVVATAALVAGFWLARHNGGKSE